MKLWHKINIWIVVLWLLKLEVFAQNQIDSLTTQLAKATGKEATDLRIALARAYLFDDSKASFRYATEGLQSAQRQKYTWGQMAARNTLGNGYLYRSAAGDVERAFEQYIQNVDASNLTQRKEYIEKAKSLNGLANIYYQWGDYTQALKDNLAALKIRERYQDERGIARSYNLMGNLYDALDDYPKAIAYYTKALNLYEKLQLKREVAGVLDNLASTLQLQVTTGNEAPNYTQAISYYRRSLRLSREIGDARAEARTYNNLGMIAYIEEDFEQALSYFSKALAIDEQLDNLQGKAATLNNIGRVLREKGELTEALSYYQQAVEAGDALSTKATLQMSFEQMAQISAALGKFEEAYEYAQLAAYFKDQIAKAAASRKVADLTSRYEIEKKQKELALQRRKATDAQLALTRQTRIVYWIVVGILLIGVIAVWQYYRNYLGKRLNKQLTLQKQEIQEKSQSLTEALEKLQTSKQAVMDSIVYARQIQDAALPRKDDLFQAFTEGFIINKPKAVVSGDFYWQAERDHKKIIVLADCTGHGVPGAFMTMMGHTLLNEIVYEQYIDNPKVILSALDSKVKQLQASSTKEVSDGMDIAIASFDFKAKQVTFAGAKSNLYQVVEGQLITHKGYRLSVGSNPYGTTKQFENQVISFQSGNVFYLFSDGFQDQFGGKVGKKFMLKRLRELLVEVHTLPMETQQIQIGKALTIWKENHAQTDDMLMIGLRI